jgi:Leucine-rich repeat (LRR) protein
MPIGTLQAVPSLEHLDLSQSSLVAFHPDILALPGLKVLKLSGNKISLIPDVIAQACPR